MPGVTISPFPLHLPDADATRALGRALGAQLQPGLIVALLGELGAGKTALAKAAIAQVASVDEDDVGSPTYVLAVEYTGRVDVLHLDAYRLGSAEALEDLDFQLASQVEFAALVEWADRVEGALPEDRLTIELEHTETGRDVTITANGPMSSAALAGLRAAWAAHEQA